MTTALVLGGASCVHEDVARAFELADFDGVICCNDIGMTWRGPIAAWVSLHSEKLARVWLPQRQRYGLEKPSHIWGTMDDTNRKYSPPLDGFVEQFFEGQTENGSSGLFALKCALDHLRFDCAVLCGVPMDRQPHFNDAEGWLAADGFKAGWTQAFPIIRDRARSMSGFTKDLLGAPTREWFGATAS